MGDRPVIKVAGLVLAAGASTRMGRPKQLLPVGGLSLLDIVLGEALSSELDHVVLVLGFKAREIMEGLKTDLHHSKLRIVENKRYQEGLSSSIISGLSGVEGDHDAVMIILGDMPSVTSSLINHLLHQYLASRLPLGAITIGKRRSHPVIIGRPFFQYLRGLKGDLGARDLFMHYPDQVCLVEPEQYYDDVDIDTLQDYHAFKK